MPQPASASIDLIKTLVGYDTTSARSNRALIDFVRQYLDSHEIDSTLIFDDSGTKANLYATLGNPETPGIALSGHSDVVPVDDQAWDSDPFSVIERENRLYGRGTADMKSFIAIALAFVPRFLSRPLKTPIHLAISYDEEVGCIGVRRLLNQLDALPVKPKACIVGEPTEMKIVTAHKGKRSLRCHVRGHECHSALAPSGVNAVEYAAEIITWLRRRGQVFAAQGPFDKDFTPAHTTLHTGVVQGGTVLNIVPRDCRFDFEIRHLPQDDPQAILGDLESFIEKTLLPEMRLKAGESAIRLEDRSGFPGLFTDPRAELVDLAKALSGANATAKVSFGTEAGLFSQHGIPAIVCGPGNIAQAHRPNEFISFEQISRCEAFFERLADHVHAH